MKIEEYLQKQSSRMAESQITEGDRAFCDSLPVQPRPQKRGKRFWALLSCGATAIIAAIVLIPTLLLTMNHEILYKNENILWENSTLSALQNDSKYFNFDALTNTLELDIRRNYDSISSDTLFYTFSADDEITFYSLTIIVNEHYHYSFMIGDSPITATLDSYSVVYSKEDIATDFEGIMSAEYRGEIKVQTETVYFEYTQAFATDEETFFAELQALIQVK